MLFQSTSFAFLLIGSLILYWALANHRNARYWLLLLASYVFYGSYEAWYLVLLVYSTLLDWYLGQALHASTDARRRKLLLYVSLVGNLSVLFFFKYTDWILDMLQSGLASLGHPVDLHGPKVSLLPDAFMDSATMRILVPAGISFYTFQSLSYTIDIYTRKIAPAKNLLEYAMFVAFFPQLVAGPIVRASEFLPQLDLRPHLDRARFHEGFYRLGRGLFKKVVLADVIARSLVDPVYGEPGVYSPFMHALCVYGFVFQVYNDFSGYSDCAIGAARLFGFKLPENFDLPYRSLSMREIWRRWHISLSTWVRDYMYVPMGGSRVGELRLARNLIISMLIIGIWHGASIHWVIYGLCMGLAQVFERWLQRLRGGKPFATTPWRKFLSWFAVFNFWTFTTLFVRGFSLGDVHGVLTNFHMDPALSPIAAFWAVPWAAAWPGVLAMGFTILTHFWPLEFGQALERRVIALPTAVLGLGIGAVIGLIGYLLVGDVPYIYFAF